MLDHTNNWYKIDKTWIKLNLYLSYKIGKNHFPWYEVWSTILRDPVCKTEHFGDVNITSTYHITAY